MPTGYTAGVADGKVTTLRDFANVCVRAFLISCRDESLDAPLPMTVEADTSYDDERLREVRAALLELSELSDDECAQRAATACAKRNASEAQSRAQAIATRDLYRAMRERVEAWQPPIELHPLREFMLSQLAIAEDFDCSFRERGPEVAQSGNDWRAERVKNLCEDIGYHETERAKKLMSAALTSRYLRVLRESLTATELAEARSRVDGAPAGPIAGTSP